MNNMDLLLKQNQLFQRVLNKRLEYARSVFDEDSYKVKSLSIELMFNLRVDSLNQRYGELNLSTKIVIKKYQTLCDCYGIELSNHDLMELNYFLSENMEEDGRTLESYNQQI